MSLNAVQIASRALLKVGASPITSFSDSSAEAEIAGLLYGSTRDAVLSGHPWSFATGQVALAPLSDRPVADYRFAYALPADLLRALSVGPMGGARGSGVDYRIREERLHASAEGIVLTYIFRPEEAAWPPFFDQVLICRLAAEFCLPLTENTSRTEMLTRSAEIELARARSVDAQQQSPSAIRDFPLIDVRE